MEVVMRRASRAAVQLIAAFGAFVVLSSTARAGADAGWFEAGDTALRMDLQLLADAQIIRLPLNQWPIPREAVRYAIDHGKAHLATNQSVLDALNRVRSRVDAGARRLSLSASMAAGQASRFRNFSTIARENGEAEARLDYVMSHFAVGVDAQYAFDADDGHDSRLDGSHATISLGNWLISANTLARWWGPAHESSLILSNNARPMPTLMIERAAAKPFENRWFNWLGPWRLSFGVSQMENNRADIDSPLFMAWRISVMPTKDVEFGMSRTAEFCGKQLVCNPHSFWNMLIGNDNVGFDVSAADEPGNQMAGFDLRWNSPIGTGPYAVYAQMIGEDESGYLPVKYLAQFGIETWHPFADGAIGQGFVEYADTSCSAVSKRGPYFNCAYNQGRFDVEGYRFHGRVIGHTVDRDSKTLALGFTLTSARGSLWSATVRAAELNRDHNPDPTDPVAQVPTDFAALELGWGGMLHGDQLKISAGVEAFEPEGGDRNIDPFGFVRWTHTFRH